MIFYFAARPETIFSVVQFGRLPDAFAVAEMTCVRDAQVCAANSTTNRHQTFVLELDFPTPLLADLLTYVHGRGEELVLAKQLKPEWIIRILVYSSQGNKLVSRLFNDECPRPISQQPEIYPVADTAILPCSFTIPRVVPDLFALKQGDLLGSRMQTLVNTVNCVGVMGKGIALAFKARYPAMFLDYQVRCRRCEVRLGEPYLYKIDDLRWVVNFPTKAHWMNSSRLEDIENGLRYLASNAESWGVTSLAVPPLGCGNGGLNWADVYSLIKKYLEPLPMAIEIYVPVAHTRAARIAESPRRMTDFFAPPGKVGKKDKETDVAAAMRK